VKKRVKAEHFSETPAPTTPLNEFVMDQAAKQWLNGLSCTAPWTLDDARELKAAIKNVFPRGKIEVYCNRGDEVHVRIDVDGVTIARVYDVV
jgi:hypothetical protein